MAKSRAQRKAEQRKRRERELKDGAREKQSKAQQRTQVPESGDVAEVEAVMETGADVADYGEHVRDAPADDAVPETEAGTDLTPPSPPLAHLPAPEEAQLSRRQQRRLEKEQRTRAKESAARRAPKEKEERKRGPIAGFFVSVWRELQRVQWPDRETLIQASAVTIVFVAIAAAYLGALDFVFSRVVQLII
ncbi:MAG: preprotein translocase subunit SecE [Solirubrobacterales bacterium]